MKPLASLFLPLAALWIAGCASHQSEFGPVPSPSGAGSSGGAAAATPSPTAKPKPIVTPDLSVTGKVVLYNEVGRFVVLSFPTGQMPRNGTTLFLYRNGLKVAEIKVSGPETDHFTVADVLTGTAQNGDEVRAE